ncbi:MAG: helix-turn-helix transcriptional regulator [Bacteroidales bacterium]|nr:helix-turn-helix transcriptional regulator [Bacteroidales bacterium]
MESYSIHIKNMVCPRCITAVGAIFSQMDIHVESIELGLVITSELVTENELKELSEELNKQGFELLEDKKKKTIDQIKSLIIKMVHYSDDDLLKTNTSEYIANALGRDYNYLSNLFSEVENITIEKYIINQKIERVKELLVYGELSLSDISYKLHYSSPSHLSRQFKQVSGFTPSEFKNLKSHQRRSIDNL